MSYSGLFRPKNKSKYGGKVPQIVYRSLWELRLMGWLDDNEQVISWSSEEIVIPYLSQIDGKKHRYYPDFFIEFENGEKYLVEIKPQKETQPPKRGKNEKRYLTEVVTYGRNLSKWEYAKHYATDRGWKFVIWTEHHLDKLGIITSFRRSWPTPWKKK